MQGFMGANLLPIFVSMGVILIIQRNNGYPDDEFFDLGRQGMGQQNGFSETHSLGKEVTQTANQVGPAAYNSNTEDDQDKQSRTRLVISKEMLILMGIAVCKILLWCLYRSARDEGLDVTSL
jgi:hypothetical protein